MVYMVFGCLRFSQYFPLYEMYVITGNNCPILALRPTLFVLIGLWHLWIEGEIGIFELFETRLMYFL